MSRRPIETLVHWSMSRPWWVVAVVGLSTVTAALGLTRLELRLDARSLIPEEHPAMAAADVQAEHFGHRDSLVVAVEPLGGDVYTPETLELLAGLGRELATLPGIVPGTVVSLATVPRLFVEDGVVDLDPLLAGPPPDPALARRLRREVTALGLDDGVLVAADGRAAAIYAAVDSTCDRRALERRARRLLEESVSGDHRAHLSGSAMAQAVLGEAAAQDLTVLIPVVLGVVGVFLTLAFGSWKPALVALAESGVSVVWTAGLMGWTGQAVFVTTLVLPVIILVIGVSDDIYALSRYRAHSGPGSIDDQVVAVFHAVKAPVLFTSATTVVALLSLAVVGLEPLRVVGVFGAVGVVLSTLLTFSLVPALLVLLEPVGGVKPDRVWFLRWAESWIDTALAHTRRGGRRWILVGISTLLLAAALTAGTHLRIEDSWIGNLPPTSDVAYSDAAINRLLAGTNTLELMVDSHRTGGLLDAETFSAVGRLEEVLDQSPLVGAVVGPFSEVIRLEAALHGESYALFRRSLDRGERTLGSDQIQQALLLRSSLGDSPSARRVDDRDRQAHLTVFVRSASFSRVAEVLELARKTVDESPNHLGMVPFGDGWIGYLTIRLLVLGQVSSLGLALALETVVLTFLFRSLRLALWAVAPVAASVLLVFGLLAAAGIPLGVASSMFAAVALGVGVDYSTHLVASCRQEATRTTCWTTGVRRGARLTGPAVLVSALTLGSGFAVLLGSEILPNRYLGALLSISLLICGGMSLLLVPTLGNGRSGRSRRSMRIGRRFAWAVVGLLGWLYATPLAAEEPTARQLVAGYNQRDTGAPGMRRAVLELRTAGEVTRSFSILQVWQPEGEELRSLFLLLEPSGLTGTSYLLSERTASEPEEGEGLQVFLLLPAGDRKVLEIRPSRFHEGLLGSDFGYGEVTWRIPTSGRSWALHGQIRLDGRMAWVVEARARQGASAAWPRVRYYLQEDPPLLLGAEYYGAKDGHGQDPKPTRSLRVRGWEQRQGVWTPTVMEMTGSEDRESVLVLEEASFHRPPLADGLLTPDALPELAEGLRQGTLTGPLAELLP